MKDELIPLSPQWGAPISFSLFLYLSLTLSFLSPQWGAPISLSLCLCLYLSLSFSLSSPFVIVLACIVVFAGHTYQEPWGKQQALSGLTTCSLTMFHLPPSNPLQSTLIPTKDTNAVWMQVDLSPLHPNWNLCIPIYTQIAFVKMHWVAAREHCLDSCRHCLRVDASSRGTWL